MLESRTRRLAGVAIVAVLALSAFGFAAANTVPGSNAGDGAGDISGFTASDIHYTLNASDPANLDSVSFTLTPAVAAGGTVKAKVTGSSYTACTGSGASWSCAVGGTVLAADSLSIVAAD
jgi:hypothetical protein